MKKKIVWHHPDVRGLESDGTGFLDRYSLAFAWLLTTKKRAFPLVVDQDNRFGYNRLDSL
jgi:hypothetical protein